MFGGYWGADHLHKGLELFTHVYNVVMCSMQNGFKVVLQKYVYIFYCLGVGGRTTEPRPEKLEIHRAAFVVGFRRSDVIAFHPVEVGARHIHKLLAPFREHEHMGKHLENRDQQIEFGLGKFEPVLQLIA